MRDYGTKVKVVIGRYFDEYSPLNYLSDGSIPRDATGKILEKFLDRNYVTPIDEERAKNKLKKIERPALPVEANGDTPPTEVAPAGTETPPTVPPQAALPSGSTTAPDSGAALVSVVKKTEEEARDNESDEQQSGARTSPNQLKVKSSTSPLHIGFGTSIGFIIVMVKLQKMFLENNGLWIKLGFLSSESVVGRHEEGGKPVTMLTLNNQNTAGKLNILSEVQITIIPRVNSETLPPFNHGRNVILQYPSYKSLTEVAEILLDHEFIFSNEGKDYRYVVDRSSIKAHNTRKTNARYF